MLRALAAIAGVAVATGAGVVVAQGGGDSNGPASASGCPGSWSPAVQGAPRRLARRAAGYHVWHDRRGWHVRAIAARDRSVRYAGRIRTARRIRSARGVRREAGDSVSAAARRIDYRFRARRGDVDGLDFAVRCGAVRFELRSGSRTIYLGARVRAPARDFTAPDPGRSGVQGRVVRGPTCPVEGAPECSGEAQPVETTVDVYRGSSSREDGGSRGAPIRSVQTDGSGRFRVRLEPGDYELEARAPPGSSDQPKPAGAAVRRGVFTNVTLTLDTGLR